MATATRRLRSGIYIIHISKISILGSDENEGAQVPRGPGPRALGPKEQLDDKKRFNLVMKRLLHRWRKLLYGFVKESETKQSQQQKN